MSIIDKYIEDIIEREGGYIDHPADKGGPTKYGITIPTLRYYWQSIGAVNFPDATDIKELEKETAKKIYKALYVVGPNFDAIPSVLLQEQVIDAGVNHGVGLAGKLLQEALNDLGAVLKVDGIVGPKTITTLNVFAAKTPIIILKFIGKRLRFYASILKSSPGQRVFAAGWFNRMAEMIEKYGNGY
jgi:lysozyme family protein